MAKVSKRYKNLSEKIETGKSYFLDEGIELLKSLQSAKFDETVEVSLRLGVDPRHADQMVRGSTVLPNGTGKSVRVAVFARGLKVDEAKNAGAEVVGLDDLVEEIKAGNINFDLAIATPDCMAVVGKIGRILGPKGLMPNPKTGTVTMNVAEAVKKAKSGQVNFRVDKKGNIHAGVGKSSFDADKLKENIIEFIRTINKAKPSASKGRYIKSSTISLTMSPPVKLSEIELADIK